MLIKAVVQAIPTYMVSIFRIPDGILDDIQSMMARFWWGSNGDTRKTHWHSWDQLCLPKKQGGMGFRDLKCFNQALLAKQIWRLVEHPSSPLGLVLKARYFKNSDVLEARRGFYPSYSWRSMWGAKSLLMEGLGWRIGSGASVWCRKDKWILCDGRFISPVVLDDTMPDCRVYELIDSNAGMWDIKKLNMFDQPTKAAILTLPISPTALNDTLFWGPNKDGRYIVKSGYWLGRLGVEAQQRDPNNQLWIKVWSIQGPPKLRHFI